MSKVDDELTRRFHRVERPVDVDGLFEGLERRRSHRERVRKVQASALAFAVLAGSVAGFVALRSVFLGDHRTTGDPGAPLPSNGEIVFVDEGADVRLHIYAAQPDGSDRRQLTQGDRNDADPHVSPDGQSVAFTMDIGDGFGRAVIATIPIEGGAIGWRSDEHYDVTDPTWSPDGSEIAYIGHTEDGGAYLYITEVNGDRESRIILPIGDREVAHPTWSPDGSRIAVAVYPGDGSSMSRDLATLRADGTGFEWLVSTPSMNEAAPVWSPDGERIAFLRSPDGILTPEEIEQFGGPNEVWSVSPNSGEETLIATAVEATLGLDLDWAPDGSALLVSDGEWLYRVDPTPARDIRGNFLRLFRGFSPSWQPVPAGGEQTSPEPSASQSPASGQDVGLGFPVCQVSEIEAQFDGLGADDTAFVATRADDGRCPEAGGPTGYVAMDVDGDELADSSYGPITCEVYYCRVFAAPDLDGDGGRKELLVVESAGSIVGLGVYALGAVGSPSNDESGVVRIEIGEPDLPQTGFVTGEPARLYIGGDEGWSYRLRCEDHGRRFIYQQRAFRPVDSDGPSTVEETTLVYAELRLTVFDAREPEPVASDDPLGPQPDDVCGATIPDA